MALMAIHRMGPVPMSEVSHKLNIEKGSFTPIANKLLALDYVLKERDEFDKRCFKLLLTKRGKELAMNLGDQHMTYLHKIIASIELKKREEFFKGIVLVNHILKDLAEGY
jgi:DNA-binding MarR family transcriptional regulator